MTVASRLHIRLAVLAVALALGAGTAAAQVSPGLVEYLHTGLNWYTIETEHFLIHFHADTSGEGASRTAQVVARIAEEVYEPITSLYEHEPDSRVSIVLKDYEDYSNGAAYFFDNKIDIWAPSLATPLRGESNWLRNVITHEFTHIIQVQRAMKGSRKVPFFYLQWLHYEDAKRPDVLYGYPDGIVTYPVVVLNNPAWFAEGTAQYQRSGLHYDRWDTHRDMILRSQVLDGKQFSLNRMGDFATKTSLERESVYNHGFAFTTYLANRFGEAVLNQISASLGSWAVWNVEGAIKKATGISGSRVYEQYVDSLYGEYSRLVEPIRETLHEGEIIAAEGFNNLHPEWSPDGSKLAYLSNKGKDNSTLSLFVLDRATGVTSRFELPSIPGNIQSLTCSHGGPLAPGVNNAVSWKPDGSALVYARVHDTPNGGLVSDLHEIVLETRKSKRITRNARASSPAYAPDGESIVFVSQGDGTTNLKRLHLATGEIHNLTWFSDGTQVYDPVWHPAGEWVYFASGGHMDGRDIYRVRQDGSELETVFATPNDERDPAFDIHGDHLYFSSDQSGIFNIYRVRAGSTEATEEGAFEPLTNVVGGAFLPSVSASGTIAYSHFTSDGYKIAAIEAGTPNSAANSSYVYSAPAMLSKNDTTQRADYSALNSFDDSGLRPLTGSELRADSTLSEDTMPRPYDNAFTGFSFFPVLRFDMYADSRRTAIDERLSRRFQGGTLRRNTKVGMYAASREIMDGLGFFGGMLLGPWSRDWDSVGDFVAPGRLVKLERDAFLQFTIRKGMPFMKKRWSPQWTVELYNIRRNVESGFAIEEFPCTACYPDTTYADVAYSLWEVDLFARSKVNRSTLLEAGYRYSPYRVRTEPFFSEEVEQSIPGSSTRYFIGHGLTFNAYLERLSRHRNAEMLRSGFRAQIGYDYEPGKLLDRFEVENGLLVPEYERYRVHRLNLDLRLATRFRIGPPTVAHGLSARVKGSTILGGEVDDFFNDYVGGLIGARGYPFYALGGNETAWFQLAYHFPILPRVDRRFLFLNLDKVYGRVYADAAAAWSGSGLGLSDFRKDVGAELRVGLGSFYLLPTALFVSATYGFDEFDFRLSQGFVTPDGRSTVTYGRELAVHFGILFDFDL